MGQWLHFGQVEVPFATIKLQHSKTNPAGHGMVLSVACICSKVCPVHVLMATLQVGTALAQAPLFISQRGTLVVQSQVVTAIKWLME